MTRWPLIPRRHHRVAHVVAAVAWLVGLIGVVGSNNYGWGAAAFFVIMFCVSVALAIREGTTHRPDRRS